MAYPVVESTSTGIEAINTVSHTVTMPSGIQVDDIIIVFFINDGNATASMSPFSSITAVSSTNVRITLFYKLADGTESASYICTTSANEQSAYTAYRVSGVNWDAGNGIAFNTSVGNSATPDPPNVSTPFPSGTNLYLSAMGWDNGTTTLTTYPGGWTDNQLTDLTNTSTGVGVASATLESTDTSMNPSAGQISISRRWVACTVGLLPLPDQPTNIEHVTGGTTAYSSFTNTFTRSVSSSVVPGDIVVISVVSGSSTTISSATLTQGTLNLLYNFTLTGGSGSSRFVSYWFRRPNQQTSAVTITFSSNTTGVIMYSAYRGCIATGDVIDVSAYNTYTGDTTIIAPSITTSVDDTMLVTLLNSGSTNDIPSTPSGYTSSTSGAATFNGGSGNITYKFFATAGSSGTASSTIVSAARGAAAIHLALLPPAAPPSTSNPPIIIFAGI